MADKKEIEIKITSDNKNLYGGKTLSEWVSSTMEGSTKQERNEFIEAFQKFTKEQKKKFQSEIEQYVTNIKDSELILTKNQQATIKSNVDEYIANIIDINKFRDKNKKIKEIQKDFERAYIEDLKNTLIESKKRDTRFIQKVISAQTDDALKKMKYVIADTTSNTNVAKKTMANAEQVKAAREKYGKSVAPVKKPITIVRAKTEKDVTKAIDEGVQFIFVESDPYETAQEGHGYTPTARDIAKFAKKGGYLKRQRSTTQLMSFLDTGYTETDEEINAVNIEIGRLEKLENKDDKTIQYLERLKKRYVDLAYKKYNMGEKSPIGNYLHRLVELQIKKKIDLNDVEATKKYLHENISKDDKLSKLSNADDAWLERAINQAKIQYKAASDLGVITPETKAEKSGGIFTRVDHPDGTYHYEYSGMAIDLLTKDKSLDHKFSQQYSGLKYGGQAVRNALIDAISKGQASGEMIPSYIVQQPVNRKGRKGYGKEQQAPIVYEVSTGSVEDAAEFNQAIYQALYEKEILEDQFKKGSITLEEMEKKIKPLREKAIQLLSPGENGYRLKKVKQYYQKPVIDETTGKQAIDLTTGKPKTTTESFETIGGTSVTDYLINVYHKYLKSPDAEKQALDFVMRTTGEYLNHLRNSVKYIKDTDANVFWMKAFDIDDQLDWTTQEIGGIEKYSPRREGDELLTVDKNGELITIPYFRDNFERGLVDYSVEYLPYTKEEQDAHEYDDSWEFIGSEEDIERFKKDQQSPDSPIFAGQRLARLINYYPKMLKIAQEEVKKRDKGEDPQQFIEKYLAMRYGEDYSSDIFYRSEQLYEDVKKRGGFGDPIDPSILAENERRIAEAKRRGVNPKLETVFSGTAENIAEQVMDYLISQLSDINDELNLRDQIYEVQKSPQGRQELLQSFMGKKNENHGFLSDVENIQNGYKNPSLSLLKSLAFGITPNENVFQNDENVYQSKRSSAYPFLYEGYNSLTDLAMSQLVGGKVNSQIAFNRILSKFAERNNISPKKIQQLQTQIQGDVKKTGLDPFELGGLGYFKQDKYKDYQDFSEFFNKDFIGIQNKLFYKALNKQGYTLLDLEDKKKELKKQKEDQIKFVNDIQNDFRSMWEAQDAEYQEYKAYKEHIKQRTEEIQKLNKAFDEQGEPIFDVVSFSDGTDGELYMPNDSQIESSNIQKNAEESKKVEETSKNIAQNIVNNAIHNAVKQAENITPVNSAKGKDAEKINKSVKKKQYLKPEVQFGESYNIPTQSQEENKPVLKDGVYVWSRTGRRLSTKQLSSRGLQNNPPSGNIQYSGGPIPVYPAGQGGDLDPNKTYRETGITVDAENKIVSRTLKEVQKRQNGSQRGSSQLDVIKQIKEDTGKIVNIMENQPAVSPITIIKQDESSSDSTSSRSKKGKSKEDKQKEKEEKQKQKEEKQAEAQRKKNNQEYAKALKTEYDYRLKIDDARRKSNITSGRERKSYQEFIKATQQQLKIAQVTAQEKRKAVTDKDAALIESGLQGQFSVKRAAMYTKDKGARNIFDLMGDDIKRAFQRITDFGVAARILNKVQKEIANVYQNILKLNEAMTDIRIVTGASVDEANSLMTSYNKLAKELGTTTTEVAKSASEWMRQGYSASESVNLITSSVKLARLGFMDMSSATTSLTAVLKGFNLQATESSEIVDKLTKLDAEYATTAGDIATALSRTAAAAKAANLDLDQTASMLTTIIDITQQDAGSVGNALKTILSRYGNVKAGVFAGMEEDGEDASESINDVEKVLNAIGIQIRSTSTEMRGFDEVLDDLAEKWDNLNDVEQNAVATAMAGVRQRNQFLALMQNFNQYKESLESSRTSSGTADEKYAAVMDSIATSMQRIQTAWESFTQKLQASEFVKGFFKAIAGIVENIDKILPNIVAMLTAIAGKHLPTIGMKVQGLFSGGSRMGKSVRAAFGRSGSFEQESLKELAEYKKGLGYKDDELSEAERKALGSGQQENTEDNKTASNTDQIKSDVSAIKAYLQNKKAEGTITPNTGDDTNQNVEVGGSQKVSNKKGKAKGTKFLKNARIASGITTGIASGLSSGMTANYGDFTSTVDKVSTGLASGLLSGIGTAIAGPIGGILGNMGGQLIGQGLYQWFHADEMARRARVDEAKKQLEATQKVETAITSAEELISKDRSEWGSEEYKQEKELIDQMRLGLQTSSSLAENFAKLSGESTEASDWIIQLSKHLTELDESVVANYRAAQILTEAQETYKAGEEDRAALYDKLGSAEASMLNQIQNMNSASSQYLEKRKEYESEYGRTVESGIASMQQARMQLDAFTDALHEGYMKAAFYSSGVSQMSSTDIAGASLDRVVAEVARAWAASDATALVFANGTLLDSARKQIVAYLKTQSDFTSLTKSPGGSLRDIMDARDEIGAYIQKADRDYEKLKNIVNQQDFKAIREFFGYDTENTENDSYIKDLIDQINKADPSNIELIAHGMNMTVEQSESLKSVIGSISLEDILNGADKLLDKFETLNGILGDISEDTILSPENMNKVVSAFPDLFKEFDENGNFTGNISYGNIVGNLAKLVTDPNGALATAYAGLVTKESLTDQNKWKILQDSVKANKEALFAAKVITNEQLSDIMTAKDFKSQAKLMLNNEKLMAEWAKIVTETTAVADYAEQARNILIEAENKSLEKQINNLQSIKDSIGDINKQREKELDLIRARDALENAKKDKKLVYRAGIGFVAQADTSAIQEAQKKVEDLQNQQTQEDLQYQIDQLNQQKSILEAIQNDPKIESIKNSAEEIKDALSKGGDGTVLGYLQTLSTDTFVDNIKNAILESIKENTADVGKEEYKSELKTYNDMVTDYNNLLGSYYKDSGLHYQDILNDPSNVYYSDVKNVIEGKQNQITEQYQKTRELQKQYFSENPTDEELTGYGVLQQRKFEKLKEAQNIMLLDMHGAGDQDEGYTTAWLTKEEVSEDEFKSGGQFYKWNHALAKTPGNPWRPVSSADEVEVGDILINDDYKNKLAYRGADGKFYWIRTRVDPEVGEFGSQGNIILPADASKYIGVYKDQVRAKGDYDYIGGKVLINELGTEAIVTPQGTLTSLPSHSGIVPADLTKNLFSLGEIAPNLIATLRNQMPNVSKSNSTNNDNSTNIGTVYATFNADSGFDMNRFMIDLRSAAGNTRHNN